MSGGSNRETHASSSSAVLFAQSICSSNGRIIPRTVVQQMIFSNLCYGEEKSSFDYFSQFFMLFFYWLDGMDGWNWAPTSRKIAFLHPERTKDMLDFHDYSKHSSHLKTIAILNNPNRGE
ncbi:hypothetical protein OUZ56_008653 [Daphnia magna]|uniref:Uncharacterized protein n=1 Tax=Daphnia magna TaxID=35525 RepID=A0ABR0AE08_9CRUS|nr:hypothetical protein OUZ56_008653 [Daphnia magna]